MLISSSLKAFACAVATFCCRYATAVEPVVCTDKQLWLCMLAYEANMPGSKCPSLPPLPPMAPDQPLMLLLRTCEDLVADHHANLRWMRLTPSILNRAATRSKLSPKIYKTRAFRSPASGRPKHPAHTHTQSHTQAHNIVQVTHRHQPILIGLHLCFEPMGHIVKLDRQVTSTKLGPHTEPKDGSSSGILAISPVATVSCSGRMFHRPRHVPAAHRGLAIFQHVHLQARTASSIVLSSW